MASGRRRHSGSPPSPSAVSEPLNHPTWSPRTSRMVYCVASPALPSARTPGVRCPASCARRISSRSSRVVSGGTKPSTTTKFSVSSLRWISARLSSMSHHHSDLPSSEYICGGRTACPRRRRPSHRPIVNQIESTKSWHPVCASLSACRPRPRRRRRRLLRGCRSARAPKRHATAPRASARRRARGDTQWPVRLPVGRKVSENKISSPFRITRRSRVQNRDTRARVRWHATGPCPVDCSAAAPREEAMPRPPPPRSRP